MLTVLICSLVVWRPLEIRNDRSTDEELHVEKAYDCCNLISYTNKESE